MSITEEAWQRTLPIFDRITQMPFIRELVGGTLKRSAFEFYILQDSIYLKSYAEALSIVGARSRDRSVCQMFSRHSAEAVEVENMLHASFIPTFKTYTAELEQAPACRAYCDFLLASVYHLPYAGGLGAILPCYTVYWEVGRHVLARAGDLSRHPYRMWIETYADEAFGAVTEEVKAVCDAAGEAFTAGDRALFLDQCETAVELEQRFWQMGYEER